MDEDDDALSVGFEIDFRDSFGRLRTLEDLVGEGAAKMYREFQRLQEISGNAINTRNSVAQLRTLTEGTREFTREQRRVESSGEALSRQLTRQNAEFGKSRDQIRAAKVETQALAAETMGLTELADRLRAQQAALAAQQDAAAQSAAREAQALRDAAFAHQMFEARAREGMATLRQREQAARAAAAAEADLAARAQRLIESVNPAAAAQNRYNAEMAEARALISAGAISLDDYVAKLGQQRAALEASTRGIGAAGASGQLAGHHMQNLAFQFQDVGMQMFAAAQSSEPLKMAFIALIQQGTQIYGIMGQAGVGIRAVGAAFLAMSRDVLVAAATNPIILGIAGVIGVFAGAIKLLQSAANSSADMEAYARSLGLTAKEIRNLDNVTVTFGDTAKAVFQVAGRAIWEQIGPAVSDTWDTMKEWLAWIGSGVKSAVNFLIGGFVGAYNVITKHWERFPAVIGDIFYTGVNAAIAAINLLVQKAIDGINFLATQANKILPEAMQIPQLSAPQIGAVDNQYAGAFAKFGTTARDEMSKAMGVDYLGNIGGAIAAQAAQNARDRIRKQALEKGYLDPEAGKTDKHAERLQREAEAVEAQIRNLYALAEAYKVSGAAALIAEARVKAESDAIKKRGDIEAMVDRQVRLAIAQRVSDAAKATAGLREQAEIQEYVNAQVAAGNVSAERAADLVKDQIADLPLLAAAQAAQQRGLADEAMKATAALADQQAERERLRQAERAAQFDRDTATGLDRLAMLRAEIALVGVSSRERAIELATIKATQEARAKLYDPAQTEQYIADQRDIAIATEDLAAAQRDYNDALNFTADKWDLIARNVQDAAQSMADAFGSQGRAIGDIASIYADFRANQAAAQAALRTNLAAANSEAAKQRELAKYNIATQNLQIGLYANMAGAAKGFFKQGSDGYKAMAAAEKAFALVQLANTAVNVAAGAAKMFASLGPFAFPAVAAMIGVMAALGFSKGGGSAKAPDTNQGTGTVLGDSAAKSESITRALNQLRDIDTLMLSYSRQMAASLRTIESEIGGFASLLVRNAESINANGDVKQGFNSNAGTVLAGIGGALLGPIGAGIGALLTKIPIVGDILKGLFGTKTTVLGSGLYGGSQSLGSILAGGFDASYYTDVQKKKKFLGFTTSNKTSTQYSNADPLLENQFTLILRSFNDAILAAAGPLGASTSEIQNRLNSFVVSIGKIDLKGLTGAQIEEKLTAVFGAAADSMASAAFPMITQFQKAGEGAFETLVRVASTLEAVTGSLDLLGQSAQGMSIAAKLGLADQFESVSDLTSAVDAYFQNFYTKEEQAAARTAQMDKVFESLGLAMPNTLAGFRQLVEAQNLNTEAGQSTYATLLKLAPAFAELQAALEGAKSAADIANEKADLQRQLLELQGDTAALRALQLAKLDESNRALQLQIWAIQDAQAAAKAADELRKAWQSVGDSIMDEVRRIRGLTDAAGGNGFATLLGQFNAANAAARGGDMDAAKSLPQLSQALLAAAADAATSRQELDRIRAQTAAALEATYGLIAGLGGTPTTTNAALLNAGASSQPGTAVNDNGSASLAEQIDELRKDLAAQRAEQTAALTAIAGNTGKVAKKMDDITGESGGSAVSVEIVSTAA